MCANEGKKVSKGYTCAQMLSADIDILISLKGSKFNTPNLTACIRLIYASGITDIYVTSMACQYRSV